MFLFSDLITYAGGALLTGAVITLLLAAGVWFLTVVLCPQGRFSLIGYAAGAVMTLFLAWHIIPACGAVALKWKCSEMESFVTESVAQISTIADVESLTPEESREVLDAVTEHVPMAAAFIDDIQDNIQATGGSVTALTATVSQNIQSSLNAFIWKSAGWSLLGLVLGVAIMAKTMEQRASRSRHAASSASVSRRRPVRQRRSRLV